MTTLKNLFKEAVSKKHPMSTHTSDCAHISSYKQNVTEATRGSMFKTREEAVAYAKEKVKTFRDADDGIEVWEMPKDYAGNKFAIVNTNNTMGRQHVVKNGGKKLGTIYIPADAIRIVKEQGVAEGSFGSGYGSVFTLYINTGEKPTTKTKTKKFKREDDAVLWAEDYADQHEMFPNLKMEIQDENGNVVWELEESQGVAEAKAVYDPITKKMVPQKPNQQKASGTVSKDGKKAEGPGLSKHWLKTQGMSKSSSETECPRCHSTDIKTYSDGEKECHHCHKTWDVKGVSEAKKLASQVKIVKGPHAGKIGWIREIKHGLYKGAPKAYYIDLEDGGQANNIPADAIRVVKEQGVAEASNIGGYPFNPHDPRNWAKKLAYDNRMAAKAEREANKPPKPPKLPKPAAPKLTYDMVWRKVEDVVSQIYPDGDPIDWLKPWFRKQGIEDYKIGDILEKAAKKNGYKDIYDYWDSFSNDLGYNQGVSEAANQYNQTASWTADGQTHKRWDKDFEHAIAADRHQSSIQLWQEKGKEPVYHASHRIEKGYWTNQSARQLPTKVTHKSTHATFSDAKAALEKHTAELYKKEQGVTENMQAKAVRYEHESDFLKLIPKKFRDAVDSGDGVWGTFYNDKDEEIGKFKRDNFRVVDGPGEGYYWGPKNTVAEAVNFANSNLRTSINTVRTQASPKIADNIMKIAEFVEQYADAKMKFDVEKEISFAINQALEGKDLTKVAKELEQILKGLKFVEPLPPGGLQKDYHSYLIGYLKELSELMRKKNPVAEAGPFSYGAKAPRKGSVAWHAIQHAKKNPTPVIEPLDQMVGNAAVKVDYEKIAAKHLADSQSKSSTATQREYAKKMHQRALEASKMSDSTAAKKHYMGVNEQVETSSIWQMVSKRD